MKESFIKSTTEGFKNPDFVFESLVIAVCVSLLTITCYALCA